MRILSSLTCVLTLTTALGAQSKTRPMVTFPGLTQPVFLDTAGFVVRMAGSPDRIYGKLRLEYASMKVPTQLDDSVGGIIGNQRMLAMGRIAGGALSRYLNCGGGISGPLADNSRAQVALISMLKPISAESTEVRTVFVGVATSLEGSLRDAVRCTSEGTLERRIHERVANEVAKH